MNVQAAITAELAVLTTYSTPTVSNALELFEIRPRNEGYVRTPLNCLMPDCPPVAGYAVTCLVSSESPDSYGRRESFEYWEHIESQPAPRIAVVQDLDPEPRAGAFFGEVNGSIHQALGCAGAVCDGNVRDLVEMQTIGFQVLYRNAVVSHGYVHPVEFGRPVAIGGTVIRPGDLLQVDRYGVLVVPIETLPHLADAVREIERRERGVLDYCRTGQATRSGLVEVVTQHLRNQPKWRPA